MITTNSRPFSLAVRLTFFISLATITAFITFAWIMIHSVDRHFALQDDNDLRRVSATITGIMQDTADSEQQRINTLKTVLANHPDIAVMLSDAQNRVLLRTGNGPDFSAIQRAAGDSDIRPDNRAFRWQTPDTSSAYRVLKIPVADRYTLLISLSINFHLHYIDELKNSLIMIATVISLIIVLIILLAVYTGHRPLRRVSDKIKNISSEDLTVRLNPDTVPIELSQLVMSFNHMIERIEDVFIRQANFSADIAHEIRTPITNLLTQTEIALSQPRTPAELEDILHSGLEEYQRLAKMISDMLFLAQADNNQLIPEAIRLDLKSEIRKVTEYFEIAADELGITLVLTGEPACITGDPLMIRRVINNLLSNALRYTPPGHAVTLAISEEKHTVHLVVSNPGKPIAPEHLPRLFDRLYRIDPSRRRNGEGSGIGLAIVKSIVTAHHGKILAESDNDSTRFIISFPAVTE